MFNREKMNADLETLNSENNKHCFMIFKPIPIARHLSQRVMMNPESYAKELRDNFLKNPAGFISWFSYPESYVEFEETLDAKSEIPELPCEVKDRKKFLLDHFESRVYVEFNISLTKINELLRSMYSEYLGKKIINPTAQKIVYNTLMASIVATHLDVKNVKTEEWFRVSSNDLTQQKKSKCVIL